MAAANRNDYDHKRCVALFRDLPGPFLLPDTVLIEACWVIGDRVGPHAHAVFLESVAVQLKQQAYVLVPLAQADLSRMAELAVKYSDLRLDPTDASVMAIAERLDVHRVATLDRRDFSVVRPRHVEAFTIVP